MRAGWRDRKDGLNVLHDELLKALHGGGSECYRVIDIKGGWEGLLRDRNYGRDFKACESLVQGHVKDISEDLSSSAQSFRARPGMLSGLADLRRLILERVLFTLDGARHLACSPGGEMVFCAGVLSQSIHSGS